MKIFLDTSSIFKPYYKESGTAELELIFSEQNITEVFLSEISKVEFTSAVWKKVRTKEITEFAAQTTLHLFESDFGKYAFVAADSLIVERARLLVSKYGTQGLRTLDSIQLATCVTLSAIAHVFFTSDKLLETFLQAENLPVKLTSS